MSEPVESQSRLAYLRLESLIVTLELAPGSMVTEKQLIALAGLGRTPVREAVQKLEWQGLIEVRPRAGLQITALDPAYPAMIYETRRQLEPLAARLMAGHIDSKAREELIACAKAMTECSVTGDKVGFLDADKLFDEVLERTGDGLVVVLSQSLRGPGALGAADPRPALLVPRCQRRGARHVCQSPRPGHPRSAAGRSRCSRGGHAGTDRWDRGGGA